MLGKKTTCLLAADASIEPGLRFLPGADELIYAGDYDDVMNKQRQVIYALQS